MKFAFLVFLISTSAFAGIKELNLENARKIADKALACGKEKGWKLSVAIVNAEGNLLVFQRGDGTYVGSIDASIDKAKSANAFQRPTKAFADGIKDGRTGLVTVKDVVGIEGGLPIQNDGVHLGAIGVSGAKAVEDEVCATKAIQEK
jgi:uncharacterized protein GlcG (DUF336 family)